MNTREASQMFEALSADTRLEVFRLLVKHAPEGLVAGDISRMLDIPATNLSFHLKGLVHSDLVTVVREGRFQRYKANIPVMLEVIAYLTAECCSGNPDACRRFRAESAVSPCLLPLRQEAE